MNFFTKIFCVIFVSVSLSGCMGGFIGGSTEGSNTNEYVKGAVVKGFPALPLYPEAKAVESYGFGRKYGAAFISDDGLDKVVEFYNLSLGQLGWESSVIRTSATYYEFSIKNNENQGVVLVNPAADAQKTAITIAVEPRQ